MILKFIFAKNLIINHWK